MSTAEWMAHHRETMRNYEPEKYLKTLKKARQRSRKAQKQKVERRLKELEGDPVALASYLKRRAAALSHWRKSNTRRSRHRLYNDSILALEQYT